MKKIITLLSLMSILAVFISACSSQTDEIYDDFANVSRSSVQDEMSDYQKQVHEIAKHIKFDTDSFYVDITLEDAIEQGISVDVYNKWLERLKVRTNEAREIISKGGKYQFVNGFSDAEKGVKLASRASDPTYGLYSDILSIPGMSVGEYKFSDYDAKHIKGVNFFCNARVIDVNKEEKTYAYVWYSCVISGVKKDSGYVQDGKSGLGNPAIALGNVAFPGDIGDDAKPHTIGFTAELEFPEEGDVLVSAYCQWMTTDVI